MNQHGLLFSCMAVVSKLVFVFLYVCWNKFKRHSRPIYSFPGVCRLWRRSRQRSVGAETSVLWLLLSCPWIWEDVFRIWNGRDNCDFVVFFFSIQFVYTLWSVFLYKKARCSQLTQEQINCFWILRNSQWLCRFSFTLWAWAGVTTICFLFTFVPSPRTVLRYNEHHHHHHDDQNECWKAWEDII